MERLRYLRAACLPFVTRTFRGRGWQRSWLWSAALAVLSVLMGVWLAFGSNSFEREMREALGLESSIWEQEYREFVVITDSDAEFERAMRDRNVALQYGFSSVEPGEVANLIAQALHTARSAGWTTAPTEHVELQRAAVRAFESLGRRGLDDSYLESFGWNVERDVQRLQVMVARGLVPAVIRYESPLGVDDGLRMITVIAGWTIGVLMLIVAPLWSTVQIAQEAHENTLPPLAGTGLSSRQLALGMASGPFAQAWVLALPQVLLLLLGSFWAYRPWALFACLGLTLIACAMLVMLGQILGFGLGHKRAPGLVAAAVLAVLSLSSMLAFGFAMEVSGDVMLVTLLPQLGPLYLLHEAVGHPTYQFSASEIAPHLGLATVGSGVLAALSTVALERRLDGRTGASLSRIEGYLAAFILIVMATFAFPSADDDMHSSRFYVTSLVILWLPWQLILVARLPLGDGTTRLNRRDLQGALFDFSVFVALHVVVATLVFGNLPFAEGSAFGMIPVVWALAVAAAISVYRVMAPATTSSAAWILFCVVTVVIALILGAMWLTTSAGTNPTLAEVNPVFGLVTLGLSIYVPMSLGRELARLTAPARPRLPTRA